MSDERGLRRLLQKLQEIRLGTDDPGRVHGRVRLDDPSRDGLGQFLSLVAVDDACGFDGVNVAGAEDETGGRACHKRAARICRVLIDRFAVFRSDVPVGFGGRENRLQVGPVRKDQHHFGSGRMVRIDPRVPELRTGRDVQELVGELVVLELDEVPVDTGPSHEREVVARIELDLGRSGREVLRQYGRNPDAVRQFLRGLSSDRAALFVNGDHEAIVEPKVNSRFCVQGRIFRRRSGPAIRDAERDLPTPRNELQRFSATERESFGRERHAAARNRDFKSEVPRIGLRASGIPGPARETGREAHVREDTRAHDLAHNLPVLVEQLGSDRLRVFQVAMSHTGKRCDEDFPRCGVYINGVPSVCVGRPAGRMDGAELPEPGELIGRERVSSVRGEVHVGAQLDLPQGAE